VASDFAGNPRPPVWRSAVRRPIIWAAVAALFVAVAFLVYAPALPGQPVFDDDAVAFTHGGVVGGRLAWTAAPYYGDLYRPIWRPLATLSLRCDRQLAAGRMDEVEAGPRGAAVASEAIEKAHRAMTRMQLLLAAAGGFLALLLFRRLGLPAWASAFGAAVLLFHPVNSESIWRLAGRAELLGHVFLLGALLLYVSRISPARRTDRTILTASHASGAIPPTHRAESASRMNETAIVDSLPAAQAGSGGLPRVIDWVLFALLFAAGLLSHETTLLLPVFLIGYELTLGSRAGGVSERAAGYREEEAAALPESPADFPDDAARHPENAALRQASAVRQLIAPLAVCLAVAVLWAAARQAVLSGWPYEFRVNPMFDYTRALETGERLRLALFLPWLYAGMLFGWTRLLPDYTQILSRGDAAPPVVLGDPSSFGVASPAMGPALLGVLTIACGLAAFVLLRRRLPRAAFGAWTFAFGLLAVLPLFAPFGTVASARFVYLPLAGLVLALLEGISRATRTLKEAAHSETAHGVRIGLTIALPVLFSAWLAWRAQSYSREWADAAQYLTRLAQAAPESPLPSFYLAGAVMAHGDLERAAGLYEETIGYFPRNPTALLHLGLIRAQQERHSLAGRILHDAAVVARRFYPQTRLVANAHLGMANLLGLQEREEDALVELQKAFAADSLNVHVLAHLGLLEAMRFESAHDGIRHITRALELDRERNELGSLGGQIRETRSRALRNLGLDEPDAGENGTPAAPTR